MLKRKEDQARFQLSATGVAQNETCFSDLVRETKEGKVIEFDPVDPAWNEPFEHIEDQIDGVVFLENPMHVLVRRVLDQLPARSQDTVFAFLEGMTERETAKSLKIAQSSYHERVWGRKGVGGIFNEMRDKILANVHGGI